MCTRVQGQFAHATTPGAPAIAVAPAKAARYKNSCASEPENVYTLPADSPTKPVCRYLYPLPPSHSTLLEPINQLIESGVQFNAKPVGVRRIVKLSARSAGLNPPDSFGRKHILEEKGGSARHRIIAM